MPPLEPKGSLLEVPPPPLLPEVPPLLLPEPSRDAPRVMGIAGLICWVRLKMSWSRLLYRAELGSLISIDRVSTMLIGYETTAHVVMYPSEFCVSNGTSRFTWALLISNPAASLRASGSSLKI